MVLLPKEITLLWNEKWHYIYILCIDYEEEEDPIRLGFFSLREHFPSEIICGWMFLQQEGMANAARDSNLELMT